MNQKNERRINWGILGAGNISGTFANALNGLENANLYAVAARQMESAEAFAKKYSVQKAYDSYETLVQDPEVDVVYIGTIHTMHFELMKLCILHKKAVLCEKPFTLNAKETDEIIHLAREYQVFVMEAMWTKFLPTTNKVKEWLQSGRIGEIKNIRADFGFRIDFDPEHRVFSKEKAGGALLDVGIYPLTYACYLMDQLPNQVTSSVICAKTGVDEMNTMLLHFEPNVLANLSSATTAEIGTTALIAGTKGVIKVPDFYGASEAYLVNQEGEVIEHYEHPHIVNGYEYEAEAVMKDLIFGKTENDIHSLEDTRNIIQLMDEFRSEWKIEYPSEMK